MATQMGLVTVIITTQINSIHVEIKNIKEQVREIMDHVEEFNNIDDADVFIRSTRYEYIFIISTMDSIDNVFNQNLHQIRHVQSILLFDPSQKINSYHVDYLRKSSYKVIAF